jgi:DNA modification methylase
MIDINELYIYLTDNRYILAHMDNMDYMKCLPDNSIHSLVTDPPAGIDIVGRKWDRFERDDFIDYLTLRFEECYRVLRPGAHGFIWAYPRTSHWTGMALENAGFQIRDSFQHIFGDGLQTGLDISLNIDKSLGKERPIVDTSVTNSGGMLNFEKYKQTSGQNNKVREQNVINITLPVSEQAIKWKGWHTKLKTSYETWWMVRKPLEGTVIDNVRKYETGGVNFDDCRILKQTVTTDMGDYVVGRAPKNIVFSHHPECVYLGKKQINDSKIKKRPDDDSHFFDRIKGVNSYSTNREHNNLGSSVDGVVEIADYDCHTDCPVKQLGDKAIFFKTFPSFLYEPKPKKGEKDYGTANGNFHPTVKSVYLCEYLIKLITVPGGVVLDPFAGSASVGVAAVRKGFTYIGCENDKDNDYIGIADKRLKQAVNDMYKHLELY